MQKSKLQSKIQKYLLIIALLFAVTPVFAAELVFDAKTHEFGIGQEFRMDVLLNTEGENINAVEGAIIFPANLLLFVEAKDGNSVINFWIERPSIPRIATNELTNSNEIIFSGITPGGYSGNQGLIFSLIFEVKNEGEGTIEIKEAKALLNDSKGTPAILSISHFPFVAIRAPIRDDSWVSTKDTERPESFVPGIARDKLISDDKWFVVFATQDKASGIDHYEIKESRQRIVNMFKKWTSAESPHVLRDQELRSFVFVKAIDKAGNERITKIVPRNPLAWYENYENWITIIIGVVIAMFIVKKSWRKKRT